METKERLELIRRNIQEVIGDKDLENLLESKDEVSVYWVTMPTGRISIAYFFPLLKIADFLKAGCRVNIFIGDIHSLLDGVPFDELEKRTRYYTEAMKTSLATLNGNEKSLEFVKGSKIQINKNYFSDLLKLSTFTSLNDAKRASSEGIKTAVGENVKMSGLIYPLMQALDEEYLKVDAQFGGVDQRKIMVYARENLPKIGYKERIELMNPMIRGLVGEKMSSSVESSKIDLMDDEATVNRKINNAECVAGDTNNGVMALVKYLIFSIKNEFIVKRGGKYGGDLIYKGYGELERDFIEKKLHPLDLKNSVAKELNKLLKKVRENKKLLELYREVYEKR